MSEQIVEQVSEKQQIVFLVEAELMQRTVDTLQLLPYNQVYATLEKLVSSKSFVLKPQEVQVEETKEVKETKEVTVSGAN